MINDQVSILYQHGLTVSMSLTKSYFFVADGKDTLKTSDRNI